MKLFNWLSKAEQKQIRNQFRNEKQQDACFLMDKNQFNKLLHKYKDIKPNWSHKRQVNAVRMLVNGASKHKQLAKAIQWYSNDWCAHHVQNIDGWFDDVLLECVERDLL